MNLIGNLEVLDTLGQAANAPELAGAVAVATTEINGEIYGYIAGNDDDGIQIVRIDGETIVPIGFISGTSLVALVDVSDLEIVSVGNSRILIATAPGSDAVSTFVIETEDPDELGLLTHVQSVIDGASVGSPTTLNASFIVGSISFGGDVFALVSSYDDDAINVFRVGADGRLTFTDVVVDSEEAGLRLNTAQGIASAIVDGRAFIYVGTDTSDNGISAFELSTEGLLTPIQNLEPGGTADIAPMTTITLGEATYLVVADSIGDRFITYSIGADGLLTALDQTSTVPNFNVRALETLVVDGVSFIVASGDQSDSIAIYSLGVDGAMTEVSRISSASALDGTARFSLFERDGRYFILAPAFNQSEVSLIEIGRQDEPLVGTVDDDQIVGLAGDDDIVGLGGNDLAFGGEGDDVVSGRLGNDTINGGAGDDVLVGGVGDDVVAGGTGADVLIGGAGRNLLDYGTSAARVVVSLDASTVSGGDAEGDLIRDFADIRGSGLADALTGDDADNLIFAGSGNDMVIGLSGNDELHGEDDNDDLFGGDGRDRMFGGDGNDDMQGGIGNDTLIAGDGRDLLVGGIGDDQLRGDKGNDILDGGVGDDSIRGGGGADVFVFLSADGNDEIADFDVSRDMIDLSQLTGFDDLGDVQAAAFTFAGNTVIDLGSNNSILLFGVTEAQLSAANFVF